LHTSSYPNRSTARRWSVSYLLNFAYFGAVVALFGVTLPALAEQTHTSLQEVSSIFLVGPIGFSVGTALGGWLLNRYAGNRLMGISQLVSAICLFCIPFSPSLTLIWGLLLLKGFFDGILGTSGNLLMLWSHPPKRVNTYMSALHFAFGLGSFLSPLIYSRMVRSAIPYNWGFMGIGSLAMLVAIWQMLERHSPLPQQGNRSLQSPTLRANAMVLSLIAAFLFFYVSGELTYGNWLATYSSLYLNYQAADAALLSSTFWLSFTIGRFLFIWISHYFSSQRIVLSALLVCVALSSGFLLLPKIPLSVWLITSLIGFSMAPIYPLGFTLLQQRYQLNSTATGFVLLGDSLGGMLLPWLVGQFVQKNSIAMPVAVLVSFGVNWLVLLWLLGLTTSQRSDKIVA
jgi:FHS family Na+ dependent glucose MFS transporter 1